MKHFLFLHLSHIRHNFVKLNINKFTHKSLEIHRLLKSLFNTKNKINKEYKNMMIKIKEREKRKNYRIEG